MHLIVGGDSIIGQHIRTCWEKKKIPFLSTTRVKDRVSKERPFIDLEKNIWDLPEGQRFDSVVFCAAITKLKACEENPSLSYQINVTATNQLATFLISRSNYLLYLSTSQVFDGSKPYRKLNENTCPISEYGRQKAYAEEHFMSLPNAGILSLTKVINNEWVFLRCLIFMGFVHRSKVKK